VGKFYLLCIRLRYISISEQRICSMWLWFYRNFMTELKIQFLTIAVVVEAEEAIPQLLLEEM